MFCQLCESYTKRQHHILHSKNLDTTILNMLYHICATLRKRLHSLYKIYISMSKIEFQQKSLIVFIFSIKTIINVNNKWILAMLFLM